MARKLAILDGMVLVGVIALGLAGARWHRQATGMPPAWGGVTALQDSHWIALTCCLAMVPLRLRRPRPTPDHLWRQPGWVACVGVSLAAGLGVLQEMLYGSVILLRRPGGDLRALASDAFTQIERRAPGAAFIAVGATWGVLALSGRWGPEKSSIDRLGRLLGIYWVIHPILGWVVEMVSAG